MVTDRLADVVLSALVVVSVVVLGITGVIEGEVVAGLLGVVLPSPVTSATAARGRRRREQLRAPQVPR